MIIECPSCHSKYQYDVERFERKPTKKIKCARCQQIFEIQNPAFAEPARADSTGARHDQTRTSRGAAKLEESTEQSPIPEKRDTDKMEAPQMPIGRRLSLAILEGPNAGNVYRIEKPRVTIGRSGADLTLDDSEASRQHAAVEVRDMVCTLSDLGSTNGTLFGGEKIDGSVELHDKSEFVVGSTTLMLIVTEDA